MRKGKYAKRGMAGKTLVLVLALVMLIGGTVGGTLAWLTDTTNDVVNTFTESDINITLEETGTETADDGKTKEKSFQMIPGWTIGKDPKVTVLEDSEDCFLFVKVVKAGGNITVGEGDDAVTYDWDDFLTYTIAQGWTQLTHDKDGVAITDLIYYREFDSDDASCTNQKGVAYSILANDQVTVKPEVTKEMMDALNAENYPTLTFTAYAVQLMESNNDEFTAAEAWANASELG